MQKEKGILRRDFDNINIINYIIYLVILVLPFIINFKGFSSYLLGKAIFLYVILLTLILILVVKKIKIKVRLEEAIIIVFYVSLIVATVFSKYKTISIFGCYGRFEGLILYGVYVLLSLLTINFLKKYKFSYDIICISGVIMGIYVILQFYGIDIIINTLFKGKLEVDTIGTIGNRNFVSTYLLIFLILVISTYVFYGKKRFVIYSTVLFGALLSTYTRSGWLSLALVMVIFIILIKKDRLKMKRICILFLVFLSIFMVMNETGSKNLVSRGKTIITDATSISNDGGSGRIAIWKLALEAISKSPFIGSGLDTFELRLLDDVPENYSEFIRSNEVVIDKAHNEFLEYWVCGGIITLISYIILLGVILINLLKRREDNICKIYFLTILGYIIQSFFNVSVIGVAPLYWILLGAAVKHYRDLDKAKEVQVVTE